MTFIDWSGICCLEADETTRLLHLVYMSISDYLCNKKEGFTKHYLDPKIARTEQKSDILYALHARSVTSDCSAAK